MIDMDKIKRRIITMFCVSFYSFDGGYIIIRSEEDTISIFVRDDSFA